MSINDIIIETEIGLNMSCSIANKLNEQREKINNCSKNTLKIQENVNTSTIIIEKMLSIGNRLWSYIPLWRSSDPVNNLDLNNDLDLDYTKINNQEYNCTDKIDIARNNICKMKEISNLIGTELDNQNITLKNINYISENNNNNINRLCNKIDQL
jgi:hypothetical protein